jgi:hypothetical protein
MKTDGKEQRSSRRAVLPWLVADEIAVRDAGRPKRLGDGEHVERQRG